MKTPADSRGHCGNDDPSLKDRTINAESAEIAEKLYASRARHDCAGRLTAGDNERVAIR